MIASCGFEVKIHEWPEGRLLGGASITKHHLPSSFRSVSWSNAGNQVLAVPIQERPILLKTDNDISDGCFQKETLLELNPANFGTFTKTFESVAAFGYNSGEVKLIDLVSKETIKAYASLPSAVSLLKYTCDDNLLAAGCFSGQIFLFNGVGNVIASLFVPFSTSINSMDFHPTRCNLLAACSKEGVLAIWDVRTNALKFNVKNHTGTVSDFVLSSTDETIASVGVDRKLNIYDLRSKELVFSTELNSELTAIAWARGSEEFAIGTSKGSILSVDRRRPNLTRSSLIAQKGAIRSLVFDSENAEVSNYSLNSTSASNPILEEAESSTLHISNITSDTKTQASGDFSSSVFSRIPGGMDEVDRRPTEEWIQQLSNTQSPPYQLINDSNLDSFKQDVINANREILTKFMEEMTTQFLRIRMNVSREFCLLEASNNKRWQEFNVTLLKLAGFEDQAKKEADEMSEIQGSEATENRQQESIYSPAKTKLSNYSQKNSTTLVKLER